MKKNRFLTPRPKLKKPALVAPAGDWPSLVTAIDNGADGVYFGVKGFNMRNLADNFDMFELKKIMRLLHKKEKKGYLALNVIVMQDELKKVETILRRAKKAEVDAVILWDMAVLDIAKKLKMNVHISTQASIANTAALRQVFKLGARRAILARECTLEDIKKIVAWKNKQGLNLEIETFIHGAMCISISGRCFLSTFSKGKSANKGQCLQYCRREFYIKDREQEADYVLGRDYILSAKDLCTIDFIEELIEAGIDSFKIEGRRRSSEYLKVVTASYRTAIDAYFTGTLNRELKRRLKRDLAGVFNRGFSSGFYFGCPEDAKSRGLENTYEKIFLGEVIKFFRKINVAEINVQNAGLKKGQKLLFTGKKTPASFAVAEELQQDHVFVKKVDKGERVAVKLPFKVNPRDKIFIWQEKYQSEENR